MDNLIKTNNLDFYYKNDDNQINIVLNNICLEISSGEFVSILGHNGCGKSTLVKHFNSILLPSGGNVYVYNMDTKEKNNVFLIRQNVGMVFQNPDNQLVATIVEEDVAFSLENLGVPSDDIRKRVDDALKSVDMYDYREHSVNNLSGGQKQRVAIAGVLAMHPKCIILDEPTAMLDPKGRKEVIDTIIQLNKELNTTVILITHYMDEAVLSDRIIVMDKGNILLDDTPRKVFSNIKLLKDISLDVPQVTEFMFELNKNGVNVPTDILTEGECVEVLFDILK